MYNWEAGINHTETYSDGLLSGGISKDMPRYTEKQLRKAIEMARKPEYWDSNSLCYRGQLHTDDAIIEELNKGNM